jgi:hypothetical protein
LNAGDIYWCETPLVIKNHQPRGHFCVVLEYSPDLRPDVAVVCFITSRDRPEDMDSTERVALPWGAQNPSGLTRRSFAIPEWSGVVSIDTLANKRRGYVPKHVWLKVYGAVRIAIAKDNDNENENEDD